MIDQYGRRISYFRISLTDRCNLRCSYCMPSETAEFLKPEQLLTTEEILRICRQAQKLGITSVRLTGGEPLLRPEWREIANGIRQISGIQRLSITTNGLLLEEQCAALQKSGIQAVNISMDSLCPSRYQKITGKNRLDAAKRGMQAAIQAGLHVKVNCVCLPDTVHEATELAALAKQYPITVRFIELMPIGQGRYTHASDLARVRQCIYDAYGTFSPVKPIGSGPAWEETREDFVGQIGWIAACSAPFCAQCNRIRLTSSGVLRPCLGHDGGADLKALLRGGASDTELYTVMQEVMYHKPRSGAFETSDACMNMNTIGG